MGMLKNETETLKEEKNKLKHDMSEKEILIKSLTGKLNEERVKQVLHKEVKNYKEKETWQYCHQAPVNSKKIHRRTPVINSFPEKDNPFWQQKLVPENSKYSDAVRNGKKTFTVGTTTVKSIRMKEVNKQLYNSFTKLRSFPGATLKHLKYYVVPSLIDETPTGLFCMKDVMLTKIQLQK